MWQNTCSTASFQASNCGQRIVILTNCLKDFARNKDNVGSLHEPGVKALSVPSLGVAEFICVLLPAVALLLPGTIESKSWRNCFSVISVVLPVVGLHRSSSKRATVVDSSKPRRDAFDQAVAQKSSGGTGPGGSARPFVEQGWVVYSV